MIRLFAVAAFALSALGATGDGTTPLHWAVHQDDLEKASKLVRAGADAKAANRYGVTPLALACTNGNGAMAELLLDAGADPNTTQAGGETVLMTASRTGRVEVVEALLRRGAKVDAKEDWRGQTALMWAAAEGHVAAVEALVKAKADFKARSSSGFTPFLFAVREGRIGAVRALLKAGADVNEVLEATGQVVGRRRAAGMSALALATTNAHFELAAHLLDAGADPNAAVPGWTSLHAVTWVRKPGLGDNDPAPQGSGNMTSIGFVKKLAAKGADLNARMTRRVNVGLTSLNTMGATTYLLAARSADAELMRVLVDLGADPKIPNADNATAIIVAAGLGTRSPGEDAGTESEVVEALQAAVDHGADPNHIDDRGETAMHGAAYKNLPGAVRFLAGHGAKIEVWNRKNKLGLKPLWIAEGYRPGNFKPSLETAAEIRKMMVAAGVSIELEPGVAGVVR